MPKNVISSSEIYNALSDVSKASMTHTGSYAYATGFYESLIVELSMALSGPARGELLRRLSSTPSSIERSYGNTPSL